MRTSALTLVVVGTALFAAALAQPVASLSGKVVDGVDNQPLRGATVALELNGAHAEDTVTNSKGEYVVSGLKPKGAYQVVYSKVGYIPAVMKVVVTAKQDALLIKQ